MMAVIETSKRAESGSDKSNKHHKYTLDEALPVPEFDDESNYWDLSD